MRKLLLSMLIIISLLVSFSSIAKPNETKSEPDPCESWQAKADSTLPRPTGRDPDITDSTVVMTGIECLLKMEGNKNPARFSGAMNNYVSQLFENTSADVAALYFISYLYHQEWDHADAVALRGSDGSVNTPKVVRDAYRSYRKWFTEVKRIGLVKAREMKLDPLKHSKVTWY